MVRPEVRVVLRAKFGMDQPFLIRYLIFLRNLATGDLGIDFDQRRPVWDLVMSVAPNTLRLAVMAILIDLLIGLGAGVLAAVTKYPFVDALITVSTVLVMCIPTFVTAVVLRASLSGFEVFGLEIFPTLPHKFGVEVPWLKEILLPAFVLGIVDAAFVARLTRGSMLEVLASDYLRTARAKGLSRRTVIVKHGLRNALIPVVNYAGISLGALMGGAVITEAIFQYDGVGYLFYRALRTNNNPVIMAIAVYSVLVFLVLSLVADLLSAYLDPRIRVT
jgi:ABC-type dipeptide/oligopeptide/nickel transport system permease component